MLNTAFIQSNLPNLQTQEQLLRDRFEEEKTKGYNFELVPISHFYKNTDKLKVASSCGLENKEYTAEELNEIFLELINGLVEGIVEEANKRETTKGKYCYPPNSILTDEKEPHSYFVYVNGYTHKEKTELPYLLAIMEIDFIN